MNPSALRRLQLIGAWCGVLYVVILIIGWALFAGFMPPHSPSDDAATVAALFRDNPLGIRIGMVIVMYAALMAIPFSAVISQLLRPIEGSSGVLVYSALMGGAGTAILTFYPAIFWLVGIFRLDRMPELMLLMDDLAWLQLVGGVSLYYALPLAIAYAAFTDRNPNPVFPRWSGYYNLWVIATILPDQMIFFFHEGPFAWNGIFGFWLPVAGFGSWFFVTFVLVRKAILRGAGAQPAPVRATN